MRFTIADLVLVCLLSVALVPMLALLACYALHGALSALVRVLGRVR